MGNILFVAKKILYSFWTSGFFYFIKWGNNS